MYMKNQIATERFKSTVSDIEIIKNFFQTPLWEGLLAVVKIDSNFIKKELIDYKFIPTYKLYF